MSETEQPQGGTYSAQYLLLKWLDKMTDADAQEADKAYFKYFTSAIQIGQAYLPIATRKIIQTAWENFQKDYSNILKTDNEITKDKEIRKLMRSFADGHRFYAYYALNKMDGKKPQEDGLVDFGTRGYEKVAEIIRNPKLEVDINADPEP